MTENSERDSGSGWQNSLWLFALLAYLVSIVPVAIACRWLEHWGIHANAVAGIVYYPVIWICANTGPGRAIEQFVVPLIERLGP